MWSCSKHKIYDILSGSDCPICGPPVLGENVLMESPVKDLQLENTKLWEMIEFLQPLAEKEVFRQGVKWFNDPVACSKYAAIVQAIKFKNQETA